MKNTKFNDEMQELKEITDRIYGTCGTGWKIILHEVRQNRSANGNPLPVSVVVGVKTHSNDHGWCDQVIGIGFSNDGNPRIAYLDAIQNALELLLKDSDYPIPDELLEDPDEESVANTLSDDEIDALMEKEYLAELAEEEEKRKAELAEQNKPQ